MFTPPLVDGTRRRLEDMLDDIMAGVEESKAAQIRHEKAQAEAAERHRVEEQLRREEEERQQEQQRKRLAEQARVDALVADAEAWDQSQKLRAYIGARVAKAQATAEASGCAIGPDSEFGKWVTWACAQADRLDPLVANVTSVSDEGEEANSGDVEDSGPS